MKLFTILSILSLLTFISCTSSTPEEATEVEIPRPLEQKNSYELVSKRGYDDLVESLYQDLVEKTPELKALEARIEVLSKTNNDSTDAFQNYDSKNQSYYSSSTGHIGGIQDSVLKYKMKALIEASVKKYTTKVSSQKQLLLAIDARKTSLNDLHTVLKITRTLAVMENYQNDNYPDARPIKNYSKELEATLKETEQLGKK